jgi:tyrosinase
MERNLANNRLTLRDRTYNLLTQASTYEAFSNDGWLGPRADPRAFDSLESVHGQIHGMCGRNGHMAAVDYAAFDPVFWLHHCNVSDNFDRFSQM